MHLGFVVPSVGGSASLLPRERIFVPNAWLTLQDWASAARPPGPVFSVEIVEVFSWASGGSGFGNRAVDSGMQSCASLSPCQS